MNKVCNAEKRPVDRVKSTGLFRAVNANQAEPLDGLGKRLKELL
jgi:hypothetical protein